MDISEKYVAKLKAINEQHRGCDLNSEDAHVKSDDILCKMLRELGFDEVVDEYLNYDYRYYSHNPDNDD